MRLLARSATNSRPRESNVRLCGALNSPGPAPGLPHVFRNLPVLSNFTMRMFEPASWPSATKMSPFGATATSDGELNSSLPEPATPALPSVSSTAPVGLNLMTWCPLSLAFDPCASVTQTLPSRSTSMPCGKTNLPAPKLLTSLPDGSNSNTESMFDPSHVLAPHRSATHTLPFGATSMALVDPHARPSGSCPQRSIVA